MHLHQSHSIPNFVRIAPSDRSIGHESIRRCARLASHLMVVWGLCASQAANAENAEGLAAELAKLRSEVESLSQEIEIERTSTRERIEAAANRKAELESELERENRRLTRLEQSLAEHKKTIASQVAAESDLLPVVQENIAQLRAYIEKSLPFQRQSRLTALDELESALRSEQIAPGKAAQRLWSVVQDEIRLTKENGLYRQTIEQGEEEILADVIRVGMVLLYFKAPNGAVGQAHRSADGWEFVSVTQNEDKKRILNLFDSFQKQVRTGLFEVPPIATYGAHR